MKSLDTFFGTLITASLAGILLFTAGRAISAPVLQPAAAQKAAREPYVFYTEQSRLTRRDQAELKSARIHDETTLKSYLVQTAMASSPLRYLNPDARTRFLSSLVFDGGGLVSFYYKDLVQLTLPQMTYVLQLFGADYMTARLSICLSPLATASPADLHAATATDELVAACQSSVIDGQTYFESTAGGGTAQHAHREYHQRFSGYQNVAALGHLQDVDVHILFNLARDADFLDGENVSLQRDMTLDFAELERRHIASQSDVQNMYVSYVSARNFSEARRFAAQHPKADLPVLPEIVQAGTLPQGMPTELVISADKREMDHRAVDLSRGVKIVVVATPECHFARHGLGAIDDDPKLSAAFGKYAVWLAPGYGGLEFDVYQNWDRGHPNEQIGIAYLRSEWPMIDSWDFPTFYFFKNGRLITKLVGWPTGAEVRYPDSGSVAALKTALKKLGVLQ